MEHLKLLREKMNPADASQPRALIQAPPATTEEERRIDSVIEGVGSARRTTLRTFIEGKARLAQIEEELRESDGTSDTADDPTAKNESE